MQETLAPAMVAVSGWHGEKPFYDPMCGPGTLLCKAMMHSCGIPAGFLRRFFSNLVGDKGLRYHTCFMGDAPIFLFLFKLYSSSYIAGIVFENRLIFGV
jgi:hypothetical protein